MHMPLCADLEKYPGQDRSTLISAFTDTPRYKIHSLLTSIRSPNRGLAKVGLDSDHKEWLIVVLSGYALGRPKANMVHSRD
jgi:hypothetical protein